MKRAVIGVAALLLLLGLAPSPCPAAPLAPGALDKPPALTLLLVVDQFRGDALQRHRKRLLPAGTPSQPGGFAWLLANGAYFPQAEHDTLHAMTGPGHATISTGAWPYRHGIVNNQWLDQKTVLRRYCVRDNRPTCYLVGATASDVTSGVSPRTLLGTTLGDALKGTGGQSKVVTVAIKDRAAVLLGGHRADLALWQERRSHRWITSRHYAPDGKLPGWVETLNKQIAGMDRRQGQWPALGAPDGLSEAGDASQLGKGSATFNALWSPFGDRVTAMAATSAVKAMRLGQRGATDMLAVSFSAHDIVGHAHGHNSREMEEMLVSTDRAIAAILRTVAASVPGGLNNVLIALTGDHGAPPAQTYLVAKKLPGGIVPRGGLQNLAEQAVVKRFGRSPTGRWIAYAVKFELFFDRKALEQSRADVPAMLQTAAAALRKHKDVQWVFTRDEALAGRWPPARFGVQAARGWHPRRSGDVVAIPRSLVIPMSDNVSHFTGYAYDRIVPLVFAGPHVRPGIYPKVVQTVDLAPTLAFLLGIVPPSLSEGRVLGEMIGATAAQTGGKRPRRRGR